MIQFLNVCFRRGVAKWNHGNHPTSQAWIRICGLPHHLYGKWSFYADFQNPNFLARLAITSNTCSDFPFNLQCLKMSHYFQLQCLLFAVFFYLSLHIMFSIRWQGLKYFRKFWNWFELTLTVLTLSSFAIFIHTVVVHTDTSRRLREQREEYVAFSDSIYWSCVWRYLNAILLFVLTLVVSRQIVDVWKKCFFVTNWVLSLRLNHNSQL